MGPASIASFITPEKKLNRNLVYDSPGIVNDLFVISCYSDLSKLYTLLKHIPRGLQAMVTELEEHITKTGKISQTVIWFSCHLQCSSHDLKSTKQAGGGGGEEKGYDGPDTPGFEGGECTAHAWTEICYCLV